jgi:UDP-GlcNAc:undecaprenyl-phosphate/decaprenyl-phosphate GlcNAc-1-phosphate transferase
VTASVMLVVVLYRLEGFSRGVFALDAVIAFCLLVASRGATSSIDVYLRKRRAVGKPALIYGAGRGGALLVRELLQNRDIGILPIGFIDDDARKQNLIIDGIPVLGTITNLAGIVSRHQISELLVAIRDIETGHLEDLLKRSRDHGVTLHRMRFSIDEVRAVPTVIRRER